MADLGTLLGASPLDASNDSYSAFATDTDGATITSALGDTPADFASMDGASWEIEASLASAPGNDTYTLRIRIVNGATILAAADAGGGFQTVATVTSATDSTFGPTAFSYVNTSADKTAWDGASIELEQGYTKAAGPDGNAIRVDRVAITGTYTTSATPQTITGAAHGDGDTFGAGTVAPGAVGITGAAHDDPDAFGAGTVSGGASGGFSPEIVTAAGSATISAMNGLRVRIDGGSWQTLAAAGLTISRTAAGVLTVSGLAGTETTVEFTYQQEIPGEPNSPAGAYDDDLFVKNAGGAVPQLSVFPGLPISQSADGDVVTAT